jgi:hypothetical protein
MAPDRKLSIEKWLMVILCEKKAQPAEAARQKGNMNLHG